ncbi:MAG: S41 family peptidase [Bacteroidota bacterium]
MRTSILLLILFCSTSIFAQDNLDFEQVKDGKALKWNNFGNGSYENAIDSEVFHGGKYSASIENKNDDLGFQAFAYTVPAKFKGKKIKLTGYLKTENVSEGYAGLWLRLDPRVAFDNMAGRGIIGTTDWKKYEIELKYDTEETQQIVFGALLVGKGKVWLDDLEVSLDGKKLENAPAKSLSAAEKDSAFHGGSGISIGNLDEALLTDLEFLGKVWGFLKYHHPAIGRGDYNWDYELFRFLPKYLEADKRESREVLMLAWIESYGEITSCARCKEYKEDAFLQADHSWLKEGKMNQRLKERLLFILQNRHQGQHYYIGMAPGVGNPQFRHEAGYSNMPNPDQGFRLLALYRYWNAIHYFFPYKHLMDKNWGAQLKAYLPAFLEAKDELEYEFAMVQIIGDIQDTHANLWGGSNKINEWKGVRYTPVYTRFIEGKLIVCDFFQSDFAAKTKLKQGDIITQINGKKVEDRVEEMRKYFPASNEPTRMRDIARDILRSNEEEIEITYLHDSEETTLKLPTYEGKDLNLQMIFRGKGEKSYKMLDNNIGYVTLGIIKEEDINKIKKEFIDCKGIIIDIRNYPSTFVPFKLGTYFLEKSTPFVKFTSGNINKPGEFTFGNELRIPSSKKHFKGKVIVLLNEISQSQAEYTSMAFRASPNSIIVGSTTAAADGNVSNINLPGGMSTMISGIGVYYPDGTETQRIGIVPDVEIKPTIKGIREGRDELLEKAIELILKE